MHAPTVPPTANGAAHRSSGRAAFLALAVFLVLIVAHAAGQLGGAAYPVVVLGGVGCAVAGVRRHQPALRWPWRALFASGVLWTLAGLAREATGATGDLSADRSLLPDAFALPGYVLFGAALYGLLRSRRTRRERGALLDGIMLAAGTGIVVYELLIAPTLDRPDTWLMARLAIAVYPAVSMCLLVLAARFAFGAGDRSVAFYLVLVGTLSLSVGDIAFAFGEIGETTSAQRLLEVPYLLVPACLGAAVLHPSIRMLGHAVHGPVRQLGRARLVAVAMALLAPIGVVATHDGDAGRGIASLLCLVLVLTAIIRLGGAMRDQAASQALLYHQATHDELTGLPSRALLTELTDAMLSRSGGGSVTLMFLDLDQFKLVNDSMGHAVGDQLLVVAAERITRCVRDGDVVARISGDEFIVVAEGLDPAGAHRLADRIREALSEAFYLDAGEVFISVSIGVTISTEAEPGQAATLIQEADTAMYRAKEAGRNTMTMFDSSMRERIARRVTLERMVRHALTERQFTVAYQPIVALPSGRLHGFEALARWEVDGHMISPAEFIPIAEDSGLIVPLGTFMLDSACRQLAEWRRDIRFGEDLHISVNLSPRQMRESDIVDTVADMLDRYDLPGDALWLEITENVMMEDSLATTAVMAALRTLDVRLAVDDFGTGFSSLSYLKRFPVSRVKIDRSFVSGLGQHKSDSSLVAAITAMAAALELEAVAEGVETPDQARRLVELGCRHAQGYLFGRAVPADEVPATITRLGVDTSRPMPRTRRCTTAAGRL